MAGVAQSAFAFLLPLQRRPNARSGASGAGFAMGWSISGRRGWRSRVRSHTVHG
jgi:hypothetical protein